QDAVARGKDGADNATEKPAQTRRYLTVRNDTDAKATVRVQYRAKTEEGIWVWVPAAPEDGDRALTFEVEAGKSLTLEVGGKKLAASRVRLWAEAADGKWLQHKDRDLWLVPETDDSGEHVYFAPQVETFTFALRRQDAK